MSIKIVSGGTGYNTKVYNSDGKQIDGITHVVIDKIDSKSIVTARLTFEFVELEIIADCEINSKNEFLDAIINHVLNNVDIPDGKNNVLDALYKMKT